MDVSVIIPCHNASSWIIRALKSVTSQSLQPREIIMIDDGSVDDSTAKVRRWSKEVIIIRTNHRNAALARNAGIKAASAKWIALLDADDEWLPDHLANASKLLSESHSVAFMGTSLYLTQKGELFWNSAEAVSNRAEKELKDEDFVRWFGRTFSFPNITVVYLRDRLLEVNGFDGALPRRHDFELFMRVIHGKTWAYSPVPTAKAYVDTPGAISRNVCECYFCAVKGIRGLRRLYNGKAIDSMARAYATDALGAAVRFGNPKELKRIYELCSAEVSALRRVVFKMACLAPITAKRIWTWRDGRRGTIREYPLIHKK